MHAIKLLHKQLQQSCPAIHAKRLETLMCATHTVSVDQSLSVTGIGRGLVSHTSAKHNIKRIDRLVSNARLHSERRGLYSALSHWLLGSTEQPVILVDWSDLTADRELQMIRAALAVEGRSLTLYEEIHPIKVAMSRKVHRAFLARLKWILPEGVRPIIVSDAGFRTTWFRLVESMGWHWLGRVRNRHMISLDQAATWFDCKTLYRQASRKAKKIGQAHMTRKNPIEVNLYLVKKPKKGRYQKTVLGRRAQNARSRKIERRQREPWLLAGSVSLTGVKAEKIVQIYSQRMQIEEGFRDIKSRRYGLNLSSSLSRDTGRLEVLLLLGTLALMLLWLMGRAAEQQHLHWQYQSNTQRAQRVLSVIYLGMQIIKRSPGCFTKQDFSDVMNALYTQLENYYV